jgi:acetyl esterase/lipase
MEWIAKMDAVAVTVEYRLAPEHPDPIPVQECYTAFKWMGDHIEELGIDPQKLVINGRIFI